MRLLLNLIWLILCGLWMAIAYAFFGLLLCLTIILIPFGLQLLKIAGYALWPFGRGVVKSPDHNAASTLGNVLWLVPGLVLALGHLCTAILQAVTIIGIPLAYANVKLIPISISPFGRVVMSNGEIAAAVAQRQISPSDAVSGPPS